MIFAQVTPFKSAFPVGTFSKARSMLSFLPEPFPLCPAAVGFHYLQRTFFKMQDVETSRVLMTNSNDRIKTRLLKSDI
jgi:hypothetical protein